MPDSTSATRRQMWVFERLTERIRTFVPVGIAALSDRLGNIVLQLPLTVLMARFSLLRSPGGMRVDVGWHPKASPRPIRAQTVRSYDGVVAGFASGLVVGESTMLPAVDGPGDYASMIWDDQRQLVLAATGPSAFVSVIGLNMQVGDPEPRVFETGRDDARERHRVRVHTLMPSQIGEPADAAVGEWTRKRIYRNEIARLSAERRFVQYKPTAASKDAERARAIGDLRHLIATFGEGGAYLWDPYLDATDILETLFFCPASGADLRALTAMRVPADSEESRAKNAFKGAQRTRFESASSNFQGLRLEYRGRFGSAGWEFHDRFLIFPDTQEGPLAWSLGASVNSLGKQHHILQRVGDGQLIADAFRELWEALDEPQHLIWKFP